MVKLQSQPVLEGSEPLTKNEICETVLGRQSGYSKGLDWGPKPKYRTAVSSSSSTMYDYQAHIMKVSELRASLENANQILQEQRLRKEERDQQMAERDRQMVDHAQQMEEMKKMLKEMSRASRGP